MSFFKKNKLSLSHNWLIFHYSITSILKFSPHIKGRVLDVGCGVQPYRDILLRSCDQIIGIEHLATLHGMSNVDVAASAMLLPFKDNSFDSLVSFQVMEHLPEPLNFLCESYRVLRPGGYLLLTTPFMWGEHETPYDFYRYTRYGLRYLAQKAGYEVVTIIPDTKFWATHALRFNYYLKRFARGGLKDVVLLFLQPVFLLNQLMAFVLDKFPHNYTVETSTFTTLLRKPV